MKRRSKAGGKADKADRRTAATPKRSTSPKAVPGRRSSPSSHDTEMARIIRERDEALERETGTAEVLRVISASSGELQPVFDAMLANATRLCQANFGTLNLNEGDKTTVVAMHNVPNAFAELRRREPTFQFGSNHPMGRVVATKRVVQIADLREDEGYRKKVPSFVAMVDRAGARTMLVVPMFKENEVIGAITIFGQEVRPFTEKQIELVQNFAAQAVIAIENARLLNELRQRTDDLAESLEQQTATSEVLRVISSSPGQLEPVFRAMLENAVHICDAAFGTMLLREGDCFRRVALHNAPPEYKKHNEIEPFLRPNKTLARLQKIMQADHVADMAVADPQAPIFRLGGARTLLDVPMIKESELIGVIGIYRQEVRPFTDKQIAL